MKKKIIAICMTLSLSAAMLVGCGSSTATTDSTKTSDSASSATSDSAAKGSSDSAASGSLKASDSANSMAKGDSGTSDSTKKDSSPKADGDSKTAGTFTVGFDQDFPPMGFVADDGSYTGFDLELAEETANRLGLKFTPQPIAWDSKDMELDSGTIDCIWNGFTITGREDKYEWTKPYLDNKQVFVVPEQSDISDTAALSGKIVEVQADSSAEAALNENTKLSSTFTMQQVADYNTAFMDLEAGAVDAIAMDEIVARYQIESRKASFKILDESISSETYGVGFKLGNTKLRDDVQDVLDEMAKDGTLAKISEKWFGEDITTVGK